MLIESPAKLNLALRILRKRNDGYHELYTLFHRISLGDTLQLQKKREGIRLFCPHPEVPKRNNLIIRAFQLLKKEHPFKGGVKVRLVKRIPVGGGLGGGSSNAAAFLLGMNRLFRLGLKSKDLFRIGIKLGSDVPFFLSGLHHAIGRGRGERLQSFRFRKRLWFVLLSSGRGLSTRKVYQNLRLATPVPSLTRISRDVNMGSAYLEKGDPEQAARFLVNDLAQSAERMRPSLRKTRLSLSSMQLGTCHMSGSGPTLYFVFSSYKKALRALHKLRGQRLSKAAILCHSYGALSHENHRG